MPTLKPRPKYLNLLKIKQSPSAIVSILHRISGALLFVGIPFALCGLQASLASEASYNDLAQAFTNPFAKLVLLALTWGLLHHFFAGLRYLAMDMHWGVDLPQARYTSFAVLIISLALTLLIGARIW